MIYAILVFVIISIFFNLAIYSRLLKINTDVHKEGFKQYLEFKKTYLKRFGEYLVQEGILTSKMKNDILKYQLKTSGAIKFGEIAIGRGYITKDNMEKHLNDFLKTREEVWE